MEELVLFVLGMIAEALGLKKKKPVPPSAPLSPARRASPSLPPAPSRTGEGSRAAFPMPPPRRLEAGDPLVSPGATTVSFAAREQALETSEPTALNVVPALVTAPPLSTPIAFEGTDDFVRAFVLQEALGPPLCRRRGPPP